MATVTKSKKPARKVVARKAAPTAKLTPPPGRSAREVMAEYPEPSADFDAKGVERIIACRSER